MWNEALKAVLNSPLCGFISYLADCIAVVGFSWEIYKYFRNKYRKANNFDLFNVDIPHIVI